MSTSGGSEPVWGNTGEEIFYRAGDGTLTAARYEGEPSFTVLSRTPLFPTTGYSGDPVHPTWDADADDTRFLFARPVGDEGSLVLIQGWFRDLPEGGGR